MRDHRPPIVAVAAPLVLTALVLSACVQSETTLLKGSEVFGDGFQLNLYGDFAAGVAVSAKTAVYHWNADRYERVTGDLGADIKFVRIETLAHDDLLVEGTDDKVFAYFLLHKLAEATYTLRTVDERNVGKTEQKRLCIKQDRDTCTIATRTALDALVRASLRKTGPQMVAVVSASPY